MSRKHHANLLVGSLAEAEFYVHSLCRDLGIKVANNPDFVTFKVETFGIKDARALNLLSTRKGIVGAKFFLILSNYLTLEAQSALLKTFEDPSPDTYFFLASRDASLILPTLASRMELTSVHISEAYVGKEAERFLSLSLKDRLAFAKKFVNEKKNLSVFLDDLLLLSRNRKVYDIIISSHNTYAAPRLVLEHLSVILP